MESVISIRNLKKTFNGKEFVLDGLNLEVPKNKITVIIGFSGTGKSVLLKHILGLLEPTSGEVRIFGRKIFDLDFLEVKKLLSRFGMLFQNAALFDDKNVLENVLFPINEHRRSLKKSERIKIAKEKLIQSGLAEKDFKKLPSEISGGMRKRCGLARALALDPDIIVYDEPTTGLDPILTEMVDDLILSTHKLSDQTTSLVVTHDLHAAFRIGDNIAMLHGGKVLLEGTAEDFYNTDIELVKKFVDKGVNKK